MVSVKVELKLVFPKISEKQIKSNKEEIVSHRKSTNLPGCHTRAVNFSPIKYNTISINQQPARKPIRPGQDNTFNTG